MITCRSSLACGSAMALVKLVKEICPDRDATFCFFLLAALRRKGVKVVFMIARIHDTCHDY